MIKEIKERIKRRKEFIPIERVNLNAQMYKPKFNNKKRVGLFALAFICLVTPMTNWLLGIVGFILNKYPLWIYR